MIAEQVGKKKPFDSLAIASSTLPDGCLTGVFPTVRTAIEAYFCIFAGSCFLFAFHPGPGLQVFVTENMGMSPCPSADLAE